MSARRQAHDVGSATAHSESGLRRLLRDRTQQVVRACWRRRGDGEGGDRGYLLILGTRACRMAGGGPALRFAVVGRMGRYRETGKVEHRASAEMPSVVSFSTLEPLVENRLKLGSMSVFRKRLKSPIGIFISHSWHDETGYREVKQMLDEDQEFRWCNYSLEWTQPIEASQDSRGRIEQELNLKRERAGILSRQIAAIKEPEEELALQADPISARKRLTLELASRLEAVSRRRRQMIMS